MTNNKLLLEIKKLKKEVLKLKGEDNKTPKIKFDFLDK